MGSIEVSKSHILGQNQGSFGISERLQNIMCYVAQSMVFEDGEHLLGHLMGIDVNARQIQRVSESYGKKIEEQMEVYDPIVLPKIKLKSKDEPVYVMIDGSMVFTRERKWMEMKLGRVHACGQHIDHQKNRPNMTNSVYINHLGNCNDFFIKLERHLIPYKHKVIVADGAKWIWNWSEDNFQGVYKY